METNTKSNKKEKWIGNAKENKDDVITFKKVGIFNALDPKNNFHITNEPLWNNNHNLFEKLSCSAGASSDVRPVFIPKSL